MAARRRFRDILGGKTEAVTEDPTVDQINVDDREADIPITEIHSSKDVTPAEDAQGGVQKIEAVTLAWSRKSVYICLGLYVFLFHYPLSPPLRACAYRVHNL